MPAGRADFERRTRAAVESQADVRGAAAAPCLRIAVLNDGRFVGLALADEMVQAMVKVPSAFGVANVTDGACASAASWNRRIRAGSTWEVSRSKLSRGP